jgi:hypothetical protein
MPRLQRSTSLGHWKQERGGDGSPPRRRDIGLRLPSFRGLGISSSEPKYLMRSVHADWQHSRSEVMSQTQRLGLRSRPSSIYYHASEPCFGSTPLLTPPEDNNSIKWNNALLHPPSSSTSHCKHHATHDRHMNATAGLSMDDNTSGDSGSLGGQQEQSDQSGHISAPRSQLPHGSGGNDEAWLDKAIEETGMYLNLWSPLYCIHD